MSERVKRHILCLQMLNRNTNTKLRNAVLANADADLICSLCECAYNSLKGNVKLTKSQKKNTPKVQKTFTPVVIETNDYSEEEEYPASWWIPVGLVGPVGRVDLSTIAETVCGSVDRAREKVGVDRPAIGGNVVSASADYDYDTCPN